jgi:hypothetical protein
MDLHLRVIRRGGEIFLVSNYRNGADYNSLIFNSDDKLYYLNKAKVSDSFFGKTIQINPP